MKLKVSLVSLLIILYQPKRINTKLFKATFILFPQFRFLFISFHFCDFNSISHKKKKKKKKENKEKKKNLILFFKKTNLNRNG